MPDAPKVYPLQVGLQHGLRSQYVQANPGAISQNCCKCSDTHGHIFTQPSRWGLEDHHSLLRWHLLRGELFWQCEVCDVQRFHEMFWLSSAADRIDKTELMTCATWSFSLRAPFIVSESVPHKSIDVHTGSVLRSNMGKDFLEIWWLHPDCPGPFKNPS